MSQKDINDFYEKIGIGSEEERKSLTRWNDGSISNNEYYFIDSSPFSKVEKEDTNA